jgi:hypothetical protein
MGCEKADMQREGARGDEANAPFPRFMIHLRSGGESTLPADREERSPESGQADTKLSDFSRPVRTMVTSCWSVIGLPKM